MDCRKMEQFISPYMDGELSQAEAEALRVHLSGCANCGRDYETMLRIAAACRHIGENVLPAPAGFKGAVMQRINNETKIVSPVKYNNWLSRNWKQSVAGAAAAVLLVFSAMSMNSATLVQVADKMPSFYQPDNGAATVTTPTNNTTTTPSGTETPTGVQNNSTAPVTTTVATVDPSNNTPVFLNKERYITSTLVQVKVNDAVAAVEEALKIAAAVPAQIQNLGQQVNASSTYTVLKITVARSSAEALIVQLGSLGTVTGQEVTQQEITTRYAETLSQYQTLVTQRATLQDASQKESLDQRITSLQNELQSWEQRAEQQTIVLWLAK